MKMDPEMMGNDCLINQRVLYWYDDFVAELPLKTHERKQKTWTTCNK